jgi:[protein-PII] uridylyltransferase
MQNEVGRLRRIFREGREGIFVPDARLSPCLDLLRRYTAFIDGVVRAIYETSCAAADRETPRTSHSGLAIVATGGYGRGELNPYSDIDIAFIPSEEEDSWVEAAVHMAFRLVMDVFLSFRDIRVGYAYRPVADASTWDLATKTAMLDARHLCGDAALSDALRTRLRSVFSPLDLLLEVRTSAEDPRRRASPAVHAVEPELKDGPGSLRDFHRARWLYMLLLQVEREDLFDALESRGLFTAKELAAISAAAAWFWRARNWTHLVTGKHSDTLINNLQDRIASELGGTSAQQWLSEHYAHAETFAAFREAAIRDTLRGPFDLGGIRLEDGALHLHGAAGVRDYTPAVSLVHTSQRHRIPVALDDAAALAHRRAIARDSGSASAEECWAFLGILREQRGVSEALRQLHNFGLLDRFIDGYSNLMRFVPPDPAHRYTVGEHSIRIVEQLEALRAGSVSDSNSQRFSELVAQCSNFDVLCLAALLHDSGKMLDAPEHSEAGLALTAAVAQRLDLAPEKRELLEILVKHHLLLVRTGRLQDLKSPGVIQAVAEKFPNVDALRHLYVFTYADTKSVGEKNWTSMDDRDLDDLYRKVQDCMTGPGSDRAGTDPVEDRRGQIRRRLAAVASSDEEAVRLHCDAMPASYILNTPLDEIALHLQLLTRLDSEYPVLDIYNRPGDDYSELTICTYDDPRPGMLAKITGVLYGCNVDIHKAQVFTMERDTPVVLDTLWISAAGQQVSEARAARIRGALTEVLTGKRTIDQFLSAGGKHPPEGIPLDSVRLHNDLSEEHTVVHVVARDLQGLLYLMTRALSRCGMHIHSAKVATWNARAENNFYVTTLAGGQIAQRDLAKWQETLTRALLGSANG